MKKQINEIKRMQLLAGLITESEYSKSLMNENKTRKIGKYITVETDEDDNEYPDLDRQAISNYLKTIKDAKEVDAFMNDGEGYDESRLHFFNEEDYDSITDKEVEKWARQEMSYFQNSKPEDESSLNENDNSQMPHQGKISFGPFKNVDWHKIREKISLVAIDSDNFRDIEDALDTKGRDYYTNKEIKYLNGKVEKIANEMSDYLTSMGIKNKVFDSPIGYGQEIDNLVVDIDINDFDKLK